MRKLILSLAFAASTTAMASIQANGSSSPSTTFSDARGLQACKVLVKKMERSATANTWRNRLLTSRCRADLSPDTPTVTALLKEINQ
jgi:hypothetical protein